MHSRPSETAVTEPGPGVLGTKTVSVPVSQVSVVQNPEQNPAKNVSGANLLENIKLQIHSGSLFICKELGSARHS